VYRSATCVFRPPPDQLTGELAGSPSWFQQMVFRCVPRAKALHEKDGAWDLRSVRLRCVIRCHGLPSSHSSESAPESIEVRRPSGCDDSRAAWWNQLVGPGQCRALPFHTPHTAVVNGAAPYFNTPPPVAPRIGNSGQMGACSVPRRGAPIAAPAWAVDVFPSATTCPTNLLLPPAAARRCCRSRTAPQTSSLPPGCNLSAIGRRSVVVRPHHVLLMRS
jgi:hypothetical protein